MFVFLSKFLPLFIYPLGLACVFLFAALFLAHRPRWVRFLLLAALALLWLGSTRWVADALARSLEWRYLPPATLPQAEVIVVLGGGTDSARYPRPTVEVNGAGDRIIYAAFLYQQGAADNLLLTGGRIDWLESGDSPAEDMAALLELMGVPPEALWLETASRNTYENAVNSRLLLEQHGIQRIILVTSALHMPRAVGLFERQGFQVIPAPTDFAVTQESWADLTQGGLASQIVNLLPSAGHLSSVTSSLKEYLGLLVYRLRGWL